MEYRKVNDFVICPVPSRSELDMNEIHEIVINTHNTWQPDRPISEIQENTIQGKLAELVIENLLAENSMLRYISYDKLRKDGFSKHAPFDGIVYRRDISNAVLENIIDRINKDVSESFEDCGIIRVDTREFMEEHGVYTIEIKSSLLQHPRDYRCMEHSIKTERTEKDYEALAQYIEHFYDYFVYPHFCRNDIRISSFYDYTKYVRNQHKEFSTNTQKFLYELMKIEYDNACNIYTRVFFDSLTDEIIIPGYVIKSRFFEEPRIQKMPSPKSKNAVYYMYHIRNGSPILNIDNDEELLRWNKQAFYAKLFGAYLPDCPTCGKKLRIVETTRNQDPKQHKFLYVCDGCTAQSKWFTMNKIHPGNMAER